jgi:hypothetical protein
MESDRTQISAVPIESSMTLGKSFSLFGLHSLLINGDAFFQKTVQVYREIQDSKMKAYHELRYTLHTDSGPRSYSWFTTGLEQSPRCLNNQARQTELLCPRSAEQSLPAGMELLDLGTLGDGLSHVLRRASHPHKSLPLPLHFRSHAHKCNHMHTLHLTYECTP